MLLFMTFPDKKIHVNSVCMYVFAIESVMLPVFYGLVHMSTRASSHVMFYLIVLELNSGLYN